MIVTNRCQAFPIGMIMNQNWSSTTLNLHIQLQRMVSMQRNMIDGTMTMFISYAMTF